jgi:hypothetical protein
LDASPFLDVFGLRFDTFGSIGTPIRFGELPLSKTLPRKPLSFARCQSDSPTSTDVSDGTDAKVKVADRDRSPTTSSRKQPLADPL